MTPLDALIEQLLDREGGIADVGDGKGITRFGQTSGWLEQFGLDPPKNRAKAAANYREWIAAIAFAPLVDAGDDLADILLDIAVMSSHQKAIKALQAVLAVKVDGVLGPVTLGALAVADRRQLARDVIAWDMAFQGRLITQDPTKARYAAGWANRMAQHVRTLA